MYVWHVKFGGRMTGALGWGERVEMEIKSRCPLDDHSVLMQVYKDWEHIIDFEIVSRPKGLETQ